MGVEQTGAGGPRRDAERLGDLGRGIAQVVVQHEDRPLIGRQPTKATLKLVPIGEGEQVIGRGRSVDGSSRRLTARRRSRDASRMQTLTRSRRSHASNRSGSRRPRRSRQAITSASCRASSARSMSRRIWIAIPNSRSERERTRSMKAAWSPRRAAVTRSRSIRLPSAASLARVGSNGALRKTSVQSSASTITALMRGLG